MRVTEDYVLFWTSKDIYSNFYYKPFYHEGTLFKWSEQAVMYKKAKLFGATGVANKILKANSPMECKNLGRSHEIHFKESIWEKNRERIYKEVLLDKFQDSVLQKELFSTASRLIVEASPYDRIWGIGYGEDHPNATQPEKWRGLNLLGKVLTEVREDLRGKC